MTESRTHHSHSTPAPATHVLVARKENSIISNNDVSIPTEIISDEEMALIEAAFSAATRSSVYFSYSSTQLHRTTSTTAGSLNCMTLLSKRRLSGCSVTTRSTGDIEDLGRSCGSSGSSSSPMKNKKNGLAETLLSRFRRNRGLSVTDITSTEWCEKQMEFSLLHGKPEATKAMRAGTARHTALEAEVVKRVKIQVESAEDTWAIRFMNSIVGANQLLFDGLTRELPLVGCADGVWMVGVVDEIRMPITETERRPIFVDTKTRVQAKLPSEAQRRNGRLQLMFYKYLWDKLVANQFPAGNFYDFFSLDPDYILSAEIRENASDSGITVETLGELVNYFLNTCSVLPQAHDQLLLRYELQEDSSLLGEDQFAYDEEWLVGQIKSRLEVWQGKREASYVQEEEGWKCRFCKFASICPGKPIP